MQQRIFMGRTLIDKGDDFRLGVLDCVKSSNNKLVLKEDCLKGNYESPEINSNRFKNLVSSWNAETPEGTEIEVCFKVRSEDKWSKWFSYGKWSIHGNRGSIKGQKDTMAYMDVDILKIAYEKEADGFKYKIIMTRDDTNKESPNVKSISAALKLCQNIQSSLGESKSWIRELDVPKRSQMVVPKIGNIICSPTSLSMVMEYYGKKVDTEEVAANVFDNGEGIYGNWSYNVAYAGSLGFAAYVERYTSADDIKCKIAEGIPVIASIRTKSKEDLCGSPSAYPSGHLLVVRGFVIKDGEEYVIVNDPAAMEHDTVRREYKLSEFEKAWGKIVYILHPDSK